MRGVSAGYSTKGINR